MASAIRALPSANLVGESVHDPVEGILPDGIPVKAKVMIDSAAAIIEVDLRDNIDCVDCGLNQTEASCLANVFTAVLNCLADDIPHNSGAFRRVRVLLRDDCIVGRPAFPHSCSACTTNVAERLIYSVQGAFAQLGEGYGLADGSSTMGAAMAVISGQDPRRGGDPYVGQLFLGLGGGPFTGVNCPQQIVAIDHRSADLADHHPGRVVGQPHRDGQVGAAAQGHGQHGGHRREQVAAVKAG